MADILQDTNVVLWEKMHTYKPDSNFRAWASAVAKNKVMQYWDKQNRIVLSEKLILAVAEAKQDTTTEHLEDKLHALNLCLTQSTAPNGTLQITWPSAPGATFTIRRSIDLTD